MLRTGRVWLPYCFLPLPVYYPVCECHCSVPAVRAGPVVPKRNRHSFSVWQFFQHHVLVNRRFHRLPVRRIAANGLNHLQCFFYAQTGDFFLPLCFASAPCFRPAVSYRSTEFFCACFQPLSC